MKSIDLPPDPAIVCPYPEQPFTHMALIASGGGFRAAAYTLGTLSYLNHVPFPTASGTTGRLLDQVTYLASASGGSLATAFYLNALVRNQSFAQFYGKFIQFLTGSDTLQEVSAMLTDNRHWRRRSKRRNLINAFSKVYDRHLDGLTLGQLMNQPTHHVREVCFNTTEFKYGMSFRFQTQETGFGNQIGNFKVKFANKAVAEQLKVGDIIAASSCFPAGFEPMLFPDDFTHEKLTEKALREATGLKEKDVFGLMDGGITDNQAVQSVMLADTRPVIRGKPPTHRFGLVLVTDVSNSFSPCYAPTQPKKSWWRPLRLPWIVGGSAALTTLAAVWLSADQHWKNMVGALMLIPVALPVALVIYLNVKNQLGKRPSLFWRNGIRPFLQYFTNLRLGTLHDMLVDRVKSVNILAGDVMLKRIRRGDFNKLFEAPAWKFRRVSNFIYDLSTLHQSGENRREDDEAERQIPPPTEVIQKVAERARLMDTTLWFTDGPNGRLRNVIATGQFTTCYNLLHYLIRLEGEPAGYDQLQPAVRQSLTALKQQLLTDWETFCNDPFWLHDLPQ